MRGQLGRKSISWRSRFPRPITSPLNPPPPPRTHPPLTRHSVHYAYGNIEYRLSSLLAAKRSYSEALRIALSETPIHPITAACYYSLGMVEYKLLHFEAARSHLEKARSIAELRSPKGDDGTLARILWLLSKVLAENVLTASEAGEIKERAMRAMDGCRKRGEGTGVERERWDEEGNAGEEGEEELFNSVVPGFFR